MRFNFFTYLGLTGLASRGVIPQDHVVHELEAAPRPQLDQPMQPNVLLPMRIGLKGNETALKFAEQWLMQVSDPRSPQYGKFWTSDQVIAAFQPSETAVETVTKWLADSGIAKNRITHSDNKAWLAFDATVDEAESLLHTEYYHDGQPRAMVACHQYHVPNHVHQFIDYITPEGSSNPADKLKNCWQLIIPDCVRALYNFSAPDPSAVVSTTNSLGIFEEGDYYNQVDLDLFFTKYTSGLIPNGTHPALAAIDGGIAPQNWSFEGSESLMDFTLAYPIIYPQNITLYQTDDQEFAVVEVGAANTSIGFFNTFFDAIDGSYCTYSAFNETGNDPIDPSYPDNEKNTTYSVYNDTLMCGVYKPTNVISISYGLDEDALPIYYQQRQCIEVLKLGLQGISVLQASGDNGVAGVEGKCLCDGKVFLPPALNSCPWITNVGATMIPQGKTVDDPEVVAFDMMYRYSSAGGFSNVFTLPAYQAPAVEHFFNNHNPPYDFYRDGKWNTTNCSGGVYNRNGRGIPDVAANGENTAVIEEGNLVPSGGTSASCPIFASLLTRIIEERLKIGKGRIGFVNPVLYQHPEVLNDITQGANTGCGTKGFNASEGWDPVTGLGTPNYPKMLELFLRLP
ncbi:peptidase S8/S53 domain-containing protein [Bombardia bombarda]|uniref:Peptidase S8/S53 domain-containing protein n=1 Tax=Bombardia bombarda TaxID=252184 RepID=A0AA40CEL0_9PEZI|nr:peptidase S8/S53 domain-containing protein [Bombardia bombarda]